MKLDNAAHEQHAWVITDVAPDFDLLDVWALPVDGDRGDFVGFLERFASFDPTRGPVIVRSLFAVRFFLGRVFGWDDPAKTRRIPGSSDTTLRARLPAHLLGTADHMASSSPLSTMAGGFHPLYLTEDEFAAEVANETVHGVLHIGWVEGRDGRFHAQLGVYVKPRGMLGRLYLRLIEPFRHLIVYPVMIRRLERTSA
jgi:hypothetical protein